MFRQLLDGMRARKCLNFITLAGQAFDVHDFSSAKQHLAACHELVTNTKFPKGMLLNFSATYMRMSRTAEQVGQQEMSEDCISVSRLLSLKLISGDYYDDES